MADTTRGRLLPMNTHARNVSTTTVDSSSSESSPERGRDRDDETEYFMMHTNDSQSTIGPITSMRDCEMEVDMEQMHRLTPISKIPPELLIAIFAKLTTTSDLRNCMLVSYHWALYSVSILWHRPLCNKWPNLQNVARTLADSRPTFPYHEMVKRLNLSGVADKVNDGTAAAFMNCKGIERLTLTSCSKLTDFGVAGLVQGSKRLQALDVTQLESLTDRTLLTVAENCSKLQGLNITDCVNITDESLVAIAEGCKQLKRLKLNGVWKATDESITAVARNCRSILEIDLTGCASVTSESVTALLSNLPHLRELRLALCFNLDNTAFINLSPKLHFDALRILDLTACEQVRDEAIARIIPAAPRLRNLVLAKCRHITDRAVDAICKLTKNLHYIHLGHCINLTDSAVINLVKHCNRIRYIDLACCSRLSDASVRHLAQLPKLRRIGLVKCQNLTDSSIMALAHAPVIFNPAVGMPHFVSLERVHLSYCINLTLKGITALLLNCPKLTHLSLTGVQAFLREDLTRFCRDAPPEFTHPQRDVFCVFSGDGVTRLRDYLKRLAREEAERESQSAIEESLLDPEDSPGADTMSDDGTIVDEDQGMDIVYGPGRRGIPSISTSRVRPRPRSLHDIGSHHVDMPLLHPEQIQRLGPWTPNESNTAENRASSGLSHLNLMSSSNLHNSDSDRDSRSPAPETAYDADLPPPYSEVPRTYNQSRRHTIESSPGFFSLPHSIFHPSEGSSLRVAETYEEPRRSTGSSSTFLSPSLPRRTSGQSGGSSGRPEASSYRPEPSSRHQYLRPESDFNVFDANHEAIMATIPQSRGQSRGQSRSNSPQVSRVSSRSRMSNLFGNMRALSSSPLTYTEVATRSIRGNRSRETSRQRGEAVLRAMMAHDAVEGIRPDLPGPSGHRHTDLPFLAPDLIDPLPLTPVTPVDSPGERAFASAQRQAPANQEPNHDVNMTQ